MILYHGEGQEYICRFISWWSLLSNKGSAGDRDSGQEMQGDARMKGEGR